jgi:hypothetical protein
MIDWIKVTPDNLPKEGEEVLIYYAYRNHFNETVKTVDRDRYLHLNSLWTTVHHISMEPTHFARINLPEKE